MAPPEIAALIDTAVRLHEAALNRQESRRWWIPVLSALLGFIGAILGSVFGDVIKPSSLDTGHDSKPIVQSQ